jgi:hypothetical protein
MNITRKITLKNCGASQKVLKEQVGRVKNGETIPVMRVVGIATGYKPGQTDKGEYLLLLGEFSAVNLITGGQYQSAKAILPNFIAESFQPVLDRNGNAEFALEVLVERKDDAVAGYQFVARPLMESKSSDRMAELIAIASKGLPALPSPTAASTEADEQPKTSKGKQK